MKKIKYYQIVKGKLCLRCFFGIYVRAMPLKIVSALIDGNASFATAAH